MTIEERTKLWLVAIVSAGVAITALIPLLCWAHLPEPMATHWSLTGVPNGKMSRLTALAIPVATLVVPTVLSWPRTGRALTQPAALLGGIAFLSCLVASASASSLLANWDRAAWRDAHLSPVWLLPAAAASGLVALGIFWVARRSLGASGEAAATLEPLALGRLLSLRVLPSPRASGATLSMLVVRDPPQQAVARMKELQPQYPGSDLRVGPCTTS